MWTAAHRERYKDDGRRYPSDLTDTEWETIKPFWLLLGSGVMECLTRPSLRRGR